MHFNLSIVHCVFIPKVVSANEEIWEGIQPLTIGQWDNVIFRPSKFWSSVGMITPIYLIPDVPADV